MYIAFEGPGGSGKSTQSKLLKEAVQASGRVVCLVREPGGTSLGEHIRTCLLAPADELPKTPQAEILLFMAARHQLCTSVIQPALSRNETVISDRCYASSFAYQVYGKGQGAIYQATVDLAVPIKPTVIILLDLSAEQSVARRQLAGRQDAYTQDEEYYRRVNLGYHLFARQNHNCRTVNATLPKEVIHEKVKQILLEFNFAV